MWVERTPDEVERWHAATERDARSHARFMAGSVWLTVSVAWLSGVVYFPRTAIVMGMQRAAGFWARHLIAIVPGGLIARWVFDREQRNELAKARRRTICPACGRTGERPVGEACTCGGTLAPACTLKWVEEHAVP